MSQRVQFDAVEEIIRASACGRDILCLTGAGVSVDAGIPHLTKLTEYLAKVQCYITKGAFQPKKSQGDDQPHFGDEYRDDPSRYVRHFGWPDPNQLNADLWQWVEQSFEKGEHPSDLRQYMDYLVRAERIGDLLRVESRLNKTGSLVEKVKKEQREGKIYFDVDDWKDNELWDLQGNWKTLLAYLTHSNPDYADTLFQSMIRDRRPGMFHRFLAFLKPILGLRLFLTVNFDDLLEEALRAEGHNPVVYAVSRDSPLPHPSLVRSQLSVIKLHGDAFRLRIGEDLDNPLDEDSKIRLKVYAGRQPLLLVFGVGGADRRVMDFVDLVAQEGKRGEASVYWLHFGAKCPEAVGELVKRSKRGAVCAVPTHSPTSFLLELVSRLTGAHPPSLHPYEPKMPRPIVPRPRNGNGSGSGRVTSVAIRVFSDVPNLFDFGASLELARFVASRADTHIPIWVDLSAMHKYQDLVVEIIRQIRQYDRSVPPLALPGGPAVGGNERQKSETEGVTKAVRRVLDALGRDRYILALNGVASFGRPPSWHHWPRDDRPKASDPGKKAREEFLQNLIDEAERPEGRLRDSILALSASPADIDRLRLSKYRQRSGSSRQPTQELSPEEKARYDDALLLLAAFRRRRSYVALLELLPRYLPEGEAPAHVDEFLERIDHHFVLRADGGEYWMCQCRRDEVYKQGQKGTWPDEWPDFLKMESIPEREHPTFRLARLARMHADLACYCYGHLFAASQEPYALLEYLYHQISSLRYLTRLDAWLQLPQTQRPLADEETLFRWLGSQKSVCELRRQRLRALRQVFHRERELLLSLICSDTLIGWIDWIRTQDIPQLRIPECLIGRKVEKAFSWQDCRVQRASVDAFDEQLEELRADALRNKMDFHNGKQARFQQIGKLVGKAIEPNDLDALENLIEACEEWLSGKSSKELLKLGRGLCDVWLCLRGMGERENTAKLCDFFKHFLEETRDSFSVNSEEKQRDLEAMTIRWLRGEVDHQLTAISPWSLRRASELKRKEVLDACEQAIEICREALGTIEWAAGDDYARHSSYFHSYKGRALYLRAYLSSDPSAQRDDFALAHRELDRAQAGLLPRIGVSRESLAVSLLRLAECLMVRADTFLEKHDPPTGEPVRALASAARELDRAADVLDQAEAMLEGARQNLEWWSCLYQLRAQIEVEHLLLQMSGYRSDDPEVSRLDARLPHTMQAGLRAVRQGLDVLLPLPVHCGDGQVQPHFRIERFLRIWIELAVCGLVLVRIGWSANKKPATGGDVSEETRGFIWERWKSLNLTAGLGALVQDKDKDKDKKKDEARDLLVVLDQRLGDVPTYGLEARRTALHLIAGEITDIERKGWERSWIWTRLRADMVVSQAPTSTPVAACLMALAAMPGSGSPAAPSPRGSSAP